LALVSARRLVRQLNYDNQGDGGGSAAIALGV
jgi:hypothetical protein